MATSVKGVFPEVLRNKVKETKIFVVGAGGIGCELLKNLVLSGFEDIELIDLDTIDVSNLNRQFLFRKEHVGKSKAQIAKASALSFNPNAKIVAYHDSIMSSDYGVQFFKRFTLIMNALDNRAARNHVNRMCLAADVPLIESGSAGYLGQVTVIKRGLFECYECHQAAPQKTYPGCTIRNTPSEPIHCIVWAKHLFNQLFGEDDPDDDVSPDTEDPEAAGDAGQAAAESSAKEDAIGGIERKSTRTWAEESGYNAEKIFHKLFRDDIKYLLSMANLWKKRRPPTALDLSSLPNTEGGSGEGLIQDQRIWTMRQCAEVFAQSVGDLKVQLQGQGSGGILVWDKDDKPAMDFVTSAANIRAFIFGIPQKSRFDVKSMAGNIIPAIATTNAVIAALIVMEALKILQGRIHDCRTVVLNRQPNSRKKLLDPGVIESPNPKCYVCSEKPEVTVALNTSMFTLKMLQDKVKNLGLTSESPIDLTGDHQNNVLKGALGMVAPDVELDDGKGSIVISSEEGETEENMDKKMDEFGIKDGARLKCDDFLQEYNINVNIAHVDKLPEEKEFEMMGDVAELQAKLEENAKKSNGNANAAAEETAASNNPEASNQDVMIEDEDDIVLMDDDEEAAQANDAQEEKKRKPSSEVPSTSPLSRAGKKRKLEPGASGDANNADDDVIVL